MGKIARVLCLVSALTAGASLLAVARSPDDDDEKAKIEAAKRAAPDVEKLADNVGKPGLTTQAEAVAKKYDELLPIMRQMKPVDKGGMKIGGPGPFGDDGIEVGLLKLASDPPAAGAIAAKAKDLQRAADVVRGIAEVVPSYGDRWAKNATDQSKWASYSNDMKKAADDLRTAIQAGNANAFKKALNSLNKSCNDCHAKFRDN